MQVAHSLKQRKCSPWFPSQAFAFKWVNNLCRYTQVVKDRTHRTGGGSARAAKKEEGKKAKLNALKYARVMLKMQRRRALLREHPAPVAEGRPDGGVHQLMAASTVVAHELERWWHVVGGCLCTA